jgi:hypothetical protein
MIMLAPLKGVLDDEGADTIAEAQKKGARTNPGASTRSTGGLTPGLRYFPR